MSVRWLLKTRVSAFVFTIVLVTVSACGGQAQTPEPTQPPTDTPAPTSTRVPPKQEAARSRYPDYNWSRLEGVEPAATGTVKQQNLQFDPLVIQVEVGERVRFENRDAFGHTVTIPGLGVDERLSGGEGTSLRFEKTGTFGVVCTVHPPDMLAQVIVKEEIAPTQTPGPEEPPTPTPTPSDGGYDYGEY